MTFAEGVGRLNPLRWIRDSFGPDASDRKDQRAKIIIEYLKCLGPNQVVTATYLFQTVQKELFSFVFWHRLPGFSGAALRIEV